MRGGYSDPRSETLLKMFNLVGIGERAGSGIPNLYSVWAAEKWPAPVYEEEFGPDRTILTMKLNTFSDSIELQEKLQEKLTEKAREVLTLIEKNPSISIAGIAGKLGVSNEAIAQRIRKLREKGFLRRAGPDKGGYWEILSPYK